MSPLEQLARGAEGAVDRLDQMLSDAVRGLAPIARARKLEKIALGVAKHCARAGDRPRELFWLERAQEAANEAARLGR